MCALLGCGRGEPVADGDVAAPVSVRADAPTPGEPVVPVSGPAPAPACVLVEPPAGFVDLREWLPTAIIVAGYHRADNFTGAPLPGYEAAGAWLEANAARALASAVERLAADDLRVIIYDAYRPRRASEAMVAWCRAHDRQDLLDDGWVAARSQHNRGLAIDIGLADVDGTPLDMGSAWDQFDARSFTRGVDGSALALRLRLRDELMRAGFEPYAREWWHFTFLTDAPSPALDRAYACPD